MMKINQAAQNATKATTFRMGNVFHAQPAARVAVTTQLVINVPKGSLKILMEDALHVWRTAFHAKTEIPALPVSKGSSLIRTKENALNVLQTVLTFLDFR